MPIERTLSLIKPNATARNLVGAVIGLLEAGGLRVVALKSVRLSVPQAQAFYEVHRERPFYESLVRFMTSGPIVALVLEGENAIARNREIMGATDPTRAAEGTIRRQYGESTERNVVHGSDAPETARQEIAFFFSRAELVGLE